MTEIHKFYSRLYDTKPFNKTQTDENLKYVTNKLDYTQIKELNKPFKEEEIREVILKMTKDKSPGEDGITAEFYKVFIADLIPEFKRNF